MFAGVASAQQTDQNIKTPKPTDANPCLPQWIAPPQTLPTGDTLTQVSAKALIQTNPNRYQLIGDVQLRQPGLVILTEQMLYDRNLKQAKTFGQIQLQQTELILLATQGEYDQNTQIGRLSDLSYQFRDTRAHGHAEQLTLERTQQISRLQRADFTTCPLDKPSWQLHFNELKIDNQKRRLYGYHTWLDFKGVPLFYTPYIDFPLDERASGLLFPYIGSHKTAAQSQALSVIALPYYFNLAPNYDDTLTLVGIQERGVVLDNEFRYLQPKHSGSLQLSLLNDQMTQSQGLKYIDRNGAIQTDEQLAQRWRLSYSGNQNWDKGLSSSLNWHEVSDPDFYQDIPLDFGYNLSRAHQNTHRMERYARINYRQGSFTAHLQHYGFLPLRNGEDAFIEKSPELGIHWSQGFGRFSPRIYAETTEFKRYLGFANFIDQGYVSAKTDPLNPIGRRSLIQPQLSYRVEQGYGQLQAQVQANYRHYDLRQADPSASSDNTVVQYSIKGGLIFERELSFFNRNLVQTLEPQLQWLYVPYVKQQHLQAFDTAKASPDFSNLFSLNRFSGFDRIGDTHQISTALTTRFLTQTGQPLADAALGQIFYLADRKIELGADRLQTETRSDIFGKLGLYLDQIYFATNAQFDRNDYQLSQIQNRFKLQAGDQFELLAIHQGFNLNSKQAADKTQTLGAGLIWQISPQWQTLHYINQDVERNQRHQSLHGLRYEDCCWALEIAIQQNQIADNRYNEQIQFMIELKGLSSVGDRMANKIKQTLNF